MPPNYLKYLYPEPDPILGLIFLAIIALAPELLRYWIGNEDSDDINPSAR